MSSGAGLVARAESRRRSAALVVLTLTVILGLGATLAAFTAAYRTQHAYPDYVRRANVADLVVNPSLLTTDADAALRSLPHVTRVWSYGLLTADILDGKPRTVKQLIADTTTGEVRGSSDGGFVAGDRLIVTSGHTPTGRMEVFVSDEYRARYKTHFHHELRVGEAVPLTFIWPFTLEADSSIKGDQKVTPIGVERVRISGFGRLPDEVLQDDEFPRQRLVVSPDLDAKYDCVPTLPKDAVTQEAIFGALFPQDCAVTYRYYALDVDSPRNVPAVEQEIAKRAAAINKQLPAFLTKQNFIVNPIITTRAETNQRVRRAIRPTVVALTLFGALAGLATMAIAALAVPRIIRRARPTNETVLALGMRRRTRIVSFALPYVLVAVVASIGATTLAFAVSPLAPVGEVRRVVGQASASLPFGVTALVLAAFLLLLTVVVVAPAVTATRSVASTRRRRRHPASGPIARVASPALAQGVRAATSPGHGAILLAAASCIAVAALTASILFGSNLVTLVDTPQRYGWPWDVAVLTNYGYGSVNQPKVHADLAARKDVASYDEVGFFSARINGKSVPAIIAGEKARAVRLPIVSGRAPRNFGEVALGADTASDVGARVGDRLDVEYGAGPGQQREHVRVVGITVFPSLGPYLADRTGLGHGLFTVVPPGTLASTQSGSDIENTFVGIHLEAGANPGHVAATLTPHTRAWDLSGQTPFVYTTQIRPPEIRNAESIRNGPVLLAALLGLALLIALGLAIAVSVNERRRDLAVLRAIGFTRAQLRRSVFAHALTTVGIGIVIGLPLGIVAGRFSSHVFAHQLGIAPDASLPFLALAAMVAVVLVGAVVAAAGPAAVAARARPAETLRTP